MLTFEKVLEIFADYLTADETIEVYAGVDPKTVQYLAGHENSKTTMDIYARVKYNKPEELFEVVNDALNQRNLDEKLPISMVKE